MIFIKNKNGFSLLEMTIAMGLAVGLLVFYMKMQGEQAKKALTAKVNQEIDTFFLDFKATLNRPGYCNKSFENALLSDNTSTVVETIRNPRGDIRYKIGEVYGNKSLKLNSITLKDFKPDDVEGFEGIATIELDIEKIGTIYGSRKIFKTMEVSVSRDQTKKILVCGPLSSGGVNINLVTIPLSSNSTNAATIDSSTNSPSSASSTTPGSSQSTTTTTSSASGQVEIDAHKLMVKDFEKNPEIKKLLESLNEIQKNKQNIEADEDF